VLARPLADVLELGVGVDGGAFQPQFGDQTPPRVVVQADDELLLDDGRLRRRRRLRRLPFAPQALARHVQHRQPVLCKQKLGKTR